MCPGGQVCNPSFKWPASQLKYNRSSSGFPGAQLFVTGEPPVLWGNACCAFQLEGGLQRDANRLTLKVRRTQGQNGTARVQSYLQGDIGGWGSPKAPPPPDWQDLPAQTTGLWSQPRPLLFSLWHCGRVSNLCASVASPFFTMGPITPIFQVGQGLNRARTWLRLRGRCLGCKI